MLWVKAFHLFFAIAWYVGLLYLPRLFVYHASCEDEPGRERFKIMERKLFFGIMTPAAVLTLVLGLWMVFAYAWAASAGLLWLHVKLVLAVVLLAYHVYCGKLLFDFRHDRNVHSSLFYRWFNEFPAILLLAIVILAVVRPF